jgi:hypothetical protein
MKTSKKKNQINLASASSAGSGGINVITTLNAPVHPTIERSDVNYATYS